MKRQLLILSLVVCVFPPTYAAGKKGKSKPNQTPVAVAKDFESIPNTLSSSQLKLNEEQPFKPGSFYAEINKSVFWRALPFFGESRNVRGKAKEVIAAKEKNPSSIIGTGDPEENSALLSEAARSHINYKETQSLEKILTFVVLHNISLAEDVKTSMNTYLAEQKKDLEAQHSALAPVVTEDKNIQQQKKELELAMEYLDLIPKK